MLVGRPVPAQAHQKPIVDSTTGPIYAIYHIIGAAL